MKIQQKTLGVPYKAGAFLTNKGLAWTLEMHTEFLVGKNEARERFGRYSRRCQGNSKLDLNKYGFPPHCGKIAVYTLVGFRLYILNIGANKFSKKSMSHLKILGTRTVTCSKFHTEDPKTLGAMEQNLGAKAI